MKIVYLGRRLPRGQVPDPAEEGDVVELLYSDWDDYGNKTTFGTTCRIAGEQVDLGHLKVMVDGEAKAAVFLDKLRAGGWAGEFPIPEARLLSVPSEITFYEQIAALLGDDAAVDAAKRLRDASYLVNIAGDDEAVALTGTRAFTKSLQRERGEIKAFLDGWKIFARQSMDVMDLGFRFRDVNGKIATLELRFAPRGLLPHDVNVLIGPNGVGKSQLLHQIVRDWLDDAGDGRETGFVRKPNLSQIVVISYSPFEQFPVDLHGHKLQDRDVYRYFGFRGRSVVKKAGTSPGGIRLTHEAPKRAAATSLLECAADDQRYRALPGWAQKLRTMERVLRSAFDFDFAAVTVKRERGQATRYYRETTLVEPLALDVADGPPGRQLIPVATDRVDELDVDAVREDMVASSGVVFVKDGVPIELSSGQKLFSFIVVNILGAIRRDSLILIDEPELFLHPMLEIQFVDMLKRILARFNSKALLATHSVVTVREVPTDCVHVFERSREGLVVRRPPFQTFGGDVQRITSYVFGDNAMSKPFERWIEEQLEELGGAAALLEQLGDEVNEELVIQIRGKDADRW